MQLSETFAGRKILLGVDRLDYIKGMPHKVSDPPPSLSPAPPLLLSAPFPPVPLFTLSLRTSKVYVVLEMWVR